MAQRPVDLIVRWLRWPNTDSNSLAPWPIICWRAPFIAVVYFGLSIAWIGVLLANGFSGAKRFWRNAT